MSQSGDELAAELQDLTEPGARGRLVARGFARSLIWRDGQVPEGGQKFDPALSDDLLDHGYAVLSLALRLRDLREHLDVVHRSLLLAAEAIESAIRRAAPSDRERGFHLVVSAAAFHIAHYAARSYSLVPFELGDLNLSSAEHALVLLMRRSLYYLRWHCITWNNDHRDDKLAERLLDEKDLLDSEDLVATAITSQFHRALATFESALCPACG